MCTYIPAHARRAFQPQRASPPSPRSLAGGRMLSFDRISRKGDASSASRTHAHAFVRLVRRLRPSHPSSSELPLSDNTTARVMPIQPNTAYTFRETRAVRTLCREFYR